MDMGFMGLTVACLNWESARRKKRLRAIEGAGCCCFNGENLDGYPNQRHGSIQSGRRRYPGYNIGKAVPTRFSAPNNAIPISFSIEVMVDDRLNSGVQIRSNSFPDYQTAPRAWLSSGNCRGGLVRVIFTTRPAGTNGSMKSIAIKNLQERFQKRRMEQIHRLCTGDDIFYLD
jgi:hypothetical protein